jgi:SAM-dependent methyltransferase
VSLAVRWHDLECGGYDADLSLWRRIAEEGGGAVLDVGAGTGRVALHLAQNGFRVVALDRDPLLLAALSARAAAARVSVQTVCADARELSLEERFGAIIVPMQTIQLLGGPEARLGFLARVREHLAPRGLFGAALADPMDGYDAEHDQPPLPDMVEAEGVVYSSRPVAVRLLSEGIAIERIRETVDPDGRRTVSADRIVLDTLAPAHLHRELVAAGLTPLPPRAVPPTVEYVGSAVVMARA